MSLVGLPSSASALQTIANQTLNLAKPVTPGAVTPQQQEVLNQEKSSGQSMWADYYKGLGLSTIAFNPDALVNSTIAATTAEWSQQDTSNALSALNLSSTDYNQYLKDEQVANEQSMKLIFTAAAVVGSIVSGGTLAPVLLSSAAAMDAQPSQ